MLRRRARIAKRHLHLAPTLPSAAIRFQSDLACRLFRAPPCTQFAPYCRQRIVHRLLYGGIFAVSALDRHDTRSPTCGKAEDPAPLCMFAIRLESNETFLRGIGECWDQCDCVTLLE